MLHLLYNRRWYWLFALLLPVLPLAAQEVRPTLFDLLTKEEGIKIALETDLTELIENKKTNKYFPAKVVMADGKSFKLEIKPRGRYRRKTCEIPPLKLKFSKKELIAEGLDTLNEFKLVIPCKDDAQGDELIVKEYLIYRMYEQLTPVSFRARLLKLTIRDSHVEKKHTMLALLVEHDEQLAKRLGARAVEQFGTEPDSLQSHQAALCAIFEYMVGNTDWEIAMMRNIKLFQSYESGKIIVAPYDFDFSGFVGAPYATPASESGLTSIRDRFLMADGLKPEALKKACAQIKQMRKDFTHICRSKWLDRATQDQLIAYLDSFFDNLNERNELPIRMKAPTVE